MEDLLVIILSAVASGGAAVAAVKWFAGKAVDHALAVHMAKYQAGLDADLERLKSGLAGEANAAQARLESTIRRADEAALGEEAAERAYRFEARKRLYTAVGPLRFQLVVTCNQYLSRLSNIGTYDHGIDLDTYYGRSLLYRIARILALTELVEWQTAYADFAVDPAMLRMLRFREEVVRALSTGEVPLDHPAADWTQEKEHIFRDRLSVIAVSLMIKDEDRVARFDEFDAFMTQWKGSYLQPLAGILATLDPTATPILWLRLLAMGQACEGLLASDPVAAALDRRPLDFAGLVGRSSDAFVAAHADRYVAMLQRFRERVAS